MESVSGATVWVCPACELLQFERDRKIHSRFPIPMKVSGEEEIEEDIPIELPEPPKPPKPS
jgi:hypothetical protein